LWIGNLEAITKLRASFVPTFHNLEQKNVASKAENIRPKKNDNAYIIEVIVAVV